MEERARVLFMEVLSSSLFGFSSGFALCIVDSCNCGIPLQKFSTIFKLLAFVKVRRKVKLMVWFFFNVNPIFLGYTGKLAAIYRKATALKTDERVRLMDEILSGIQVIKMYAWEKPFAKLIRFARKAEVKIITKSSYVRGLYMAFNLFTTRLALFATLLTMALTDRTITAPKVKLHYFLIKSYCTFNIK